MSALHLQSISKRYDAGAHVLQPMSLEVASGELVVLVGPSGCGKSTLLKIIAGLEPPSDGRILLGERDVTSLAPRHRNIAMVFQNYALYPHLTVFENLAYPLRRMRVARRAIAERVAAVAAQLQIDSLLDRRPAQLSGGQKQRVAMGRALIREPELFLLDEPLSNLDATLRAHVRGEIKALQTRLRTTMIYVTHDQVEAQVLADRLVVMRDGVVQQIGTPQQVYRAPANLFAASFLGAPPPNFVEARRHDDGEGFTLLGTSTPIDCLPKPAREALLAEGRVIVALRPEDIRHPGIPDEELRFAVTLERRETVGHQVYAYLKPDTAFPDLARFIGRELEDALLWLTTADRDGVPPSLAIPFDRLLFFSASTGQALNSAMSTGSSAEAAVTTSFDRYSMPSA